ncbi:hypothetical protein ACFZDG_15420 [Kitasatospora xanthocidica]|uniref:hypothetical protein n=1 Tax=Kitasatospora xanthocidica TaxID=83382 RepID=UPI0036E95509
MSGRDGRGTDGRPPGAAAAGGPALPAPGCTARSERGGTPLPAPGCTAPGRRGGTPPPAPGGTARSRHDGPGVRR